MNQLEQLQKAEHNHYITAKHVLNLTNRAYELFVNSEIEEKQLPTRFVLSNLRIEDDKVLYDAQMPFDMILKTTDSKLWQG